MATLLLLLCGPALADPAVNVNVTIKGELLLIDILTPRPQPEPSLRTSRSPGFLEVALPKTVLKTKFTKAIDKGLVQRVQTLESSNTSLARVYFLSEPKAKLAPIQGGYRYTVHLNSMAPATSAATATPAVTAQPSSTDPEVTVLTNRPAGEQPVKVLTNKPAEKQPVKVLTNKPVASNTPKPAVAGDKVTTPVTLVFKDAELTDALALLAQKAGLKAAIDPSLRGVINLSLSEIPFDEALKLLVEPLGDSVETRVSGGTVYVARRKEATPVAATPSGPTVVEYFPFEAKSVDTWLDTARKVVPQLNYYVDSELNVLIAEGSAADIEKLSSLLRAKSKK